MPANIYNTVIDQFADWTEKVSVANVEIAAPLNMTGYTAKLEGRTKYDDATALFSISTTANSSGSITLGSDGLISWRLAASVTKTLAAPSNVFYDLVITAPSGNMVRVVEGIATVSPGATKQ